MTLEGGEGAGKTTQIRRLRAHLESRGHAVTVTREPGGTPGAEAIRALLVQGEAGRWLPMSELLLLQAARHDHIERLIRPRLEAGDWVLCDRFHDSTRVYQGLAGGLGLEQVDRLIAPVLAGHLPDLTVLLDLPVEVGLARRQSAGQETRFERMGEAFHARVRAGFLALARAEPERIAIVDATGDENAVAAAILHALVVHFPELDSDDRTER